MIKKGQKVMILNAHVNGTHGEGIVLRPSDSYGQLGKWVVLHEHMEMNIEPERLVDEEEYWQAYRRNYRTKKSDT